MPSSKQRLEVWRGVRAKTSGGLRKEDLTKNKRGKIVSKKKSSQAFEQNNLGGFLRKKGTKVPKDEMLYKKGAKTPSKPAPKKAAKASPKKAPAKAKPAAPKPKPKQAPRKPAPKPIQKKRKKARKINPVTKQPYAKKSKSGFVEKGKVHLDNLKKGKRKDKPKAATFTKEEGGIDHEEGGPAPPPTQAGILQT